MVFQTGKVSRPPSWKKKSLLPFKETYVVFGSPFVYALILEITKGKGPLNMN